MNTLAYILQQKILNLIWMRWIFGYQHDKTSNLSLFFIKKSLYDNLKQNFSLYSKGYHPQPTYFFSCLQGLLFYLSLKCFFPNITPIHVPENNERTCCTREFRACLNILTTDSSFYSNVNGAKLIPFQSKYIKFSDML